MVVHLSCAEAPVAVHLWCAEASWLCTFGVRRPHGCALLVCGGLMVVHLSCAEASWLCTSVPRPHGCALLVC